MFGSSVLDTAIGMAFFYLFVSLVCSGINEAIASFLNKRGTNLFEGIKNLLNDKSFQGLAQQVYCHGLVDGITKQGRLPSYIPSRVFALSLLDIIAARGIGVSVCEDLDRRKHEMPAETYEAQRQEAGGVVGLIQAALKAAEQVAGPRDIRQIEKASAALHDALAAGRTLVAQFPDPLASIQRSVDKLPPGPAREALRVLVAETRREVGAKPIPEQLKALERTIEQWFNDAMDRVSGWYKRWTQIVVLIISAIVVCATNADSIALANRLAQDSALRAQFVVAAERATTSATPKVVTKELVDQSRKLEMPLGWEPGENGSIPGSGSEWLYKVIGLLISIFAVSLGAPWWFDTLSKAVNLRGAGAPPGERNRSAATAASLDLKVEKR